MQGPAEVSTASLVDANAKYPSNVLAGGALPVQVEMAMQAEASRRQLDTIYLNIDAAKNRLSAMDGRAKSAISEWKLPQRLRKFVVENPDVIDSAIVRQLVVLEAKSIADEGLHVNAKYIAAFPLVVLSDDAEVKEVDSFAARFRELEQEQNLLELLLVHETRNLALAESQVTAQRVTASSSPLRNKSVRAPSSDATTIANTSAIPSANAAGQVVDEQEEGRSTPVQAPNKSAPQPPLSPWAKYLPNAATTEPTAVGRTNRKPFDPTLSDDDRLCAYLESLLEQVSEGETRIRELEVSLDTAKRQTVQAREEAEMAQSQSRMHEEDRAQALAELREQVAQNEQLEGQLAAAVARRSTFEARATTQDESVRRQVIELEWRSIALDLYSRTQLFARREADAREERASRKYLIERASAEASDVARAESERDRAVAIRDAEEARHRAAALEDGLQQATSLSRVEHEGLLAQLREARLTIMKKDEETTALQAKVKELEIRLDIAASTSVTSKSAHRAALDQAVRDGESVVKTLPISSRYKSPVAGSIRAQLQDKKADDALPRPRGSAPLPTSRDRNGQ